MIEPASEITASGKRRLQAKKVACSKRVPRKKRLKGGPKYPVTILKDTGAAQSVLLSNVIPNITNAFTGEKVLLHVRLPIP